MPDATQRPQRFRTFLFIVIGAWVAVAAAGVATVLLVPDRHRVYERVIFSSLSIGFFSLVMLACAYIWQRGRWRLIPLFGLLFSTVALLANLAIIWLNLSPPNAVTLVQLTIVTASWGALMPLLCFLGSARLRGAWAWTRRAAQFSAAVLASVISLVVLVGRFAGDAELLLMATAIIAACASLSVLALHCLADIRTSDEYVTTALAVALTCPRCATAQQVAAGRSKCGKCGLGFRIDIEEERCAKCGYLLYQLTTDRCPECGTPTFAAAVTTNAARLAESPPSDPPPAT